jgi:hypothetical protein
MKKILFLVLICSFLSQLAIAAPICNWSAIKQLPDGGYEYSPALNLCVGNLVQQNKVQAAQIVDLTKAISLKDLAINMSDARVALWEKSSDDEFSRLNTIEKDQKHSDFLMFGLGILTTIGTGFAIARLAGR